MKRPSLRNQRGVAMMMALVTFLVLAILIGELSYETGVYNGVVWKQVDQLRARLLARSAMRLALLQLRAAQKAKSQAKSMGLGDGSDAVTEQIWKTPLVLPPPAPPGFGVAETQALETFSKSLDLQGSLSVSITGNNGRLSLNQLVWVKEGKDNTAGGAASGGVPLDASGNPVPQGQGTQSTVDPAQEAQKKQEALEKSKKALVEVVDQLLESKRRSDDDFRDRYGVLNGETLVGNLAAWMNPDVKMDGDNREKNDYYSRIEPNHYALKDAPMSSDTELFMVKGFDDTLARLFSENFTVQSTGGVDVNEASATLLRSLIPELGDMEVEKILQRRKDAALGGPFKSADDFWSYLNSFGDYKSSQERLTAQGISMMGAQTSYRVVVTAKSGNATKTWVADVGPMPPKVDPEAPAAPGAAPLAPKPNTANIDDTADELETKANNNSKSGGKNDSNSLNIIYLKGD